MRYTKISGTFLKFDTKQRIETGISYASQNMALDRHEITVRTFGNGKNIVTHFVLQAPDYLDFIATSDDPTIPQMNGHFFNTDFDECTLGATLNDQKINVTGTVTKLDESHALSTKIVTEISSGKIVGIMQERIELISEETFKAAIVE